MITAHKRPRLLQAAEPTGLDYEMSLVGEVGWDIRASEFVEQLRRADGGPVDLFIDSPGGDIFEGVAVYQALLNHPGHVSIRIGALAASAASVIAMAADDLKMSSSSLLMIHEAWSMSVGPADDHRATADLLDLVSDNIAAIYQARAGGTVREWRGRMKSETWYSPSEAVAAGLADRVSDGQALSASVRQARAQAAVYAPVTAGPVAAVVRESLRAYSGRAAGVPFAAAGARHPRPAGRRTPPDMMHLIRRLHVRGARPHGIAR